MDLSRASDIFKGQYVTVAAFSPEHERPSPVNPPLQVQLCPPTVLVQLAFTSQSWLPLLHSSISTVIRKNKTFNAWHSYHSSYQSIYLNKSVHLQYILPYKCSYVHQQCWYSWHSRHSHGHCCYIHRYLDSKRQQIFITPY